MVRKVWKQDRRGAVVVLVAVSGTLIAGFGALTIDLGNMYIARTELQRAADGAALAAAAKLARYQSGQSEAAARTEAKRIVEANPVLADKVTIDINRDVVFGHTDWDNAASRFRFVQGGAVVSAVRVTVRKTADSPNGPMNLLFANIWGKASKNMWASATAMMIPRDISVVADLSGSMDDDSELQHYKDIGINLWSVWVCLPVHKGTSSVGDGVHALTAATPIDQSGRLYSSPSQNATFRGPIWARMNTWGTLDITSSYNPTADAGLMYLPKSVAWTSSSYNSLKTWLQNVGYSSSEITDLTSSANDGSGYYKYRTAVALGLARWDSGKSGGLWSTLPAADIQATRGNGDSKISSNELCWLVSYPFSQGSWLEYIDTYMSSSSTAMENTNTNFRYRYGLKTFVNYLLEKRNHYADTPDLAQTPEQPVQAVKDAVDYCMNLITEQESDDQVSLEIFAQSARHMKNLTKTCSQVSDTLKGMQAGHFDDWTNTGGGIDKGIIELTSSRSRPNAAKIMFLLSDGQANVNSSGGTNDYPGGKSFAILKAQQAVNKGITIYCVSMGVNSDRPFMQQIAEMASGEEFFAAGTIDQYSLQLKDIFAELSTKRPVRLID